MGGTSTWWPAASCSTAKSTTPSCPSAQQLKRAHEKNRHVTACGHACLRSTSQRFCESGMSCVQVGCFIRCGVSSGGAFHFAGGGPLRVGCGNHLVGAPAKAGAFLFDRTLVSLIFDQVATDSGCCSW